MIPINLGGYATQIGRGGQFRTPATPPQRAPAQPAQTPDIQREARAYGLAEALSEPIEIGSGSWAEALAEGLAGGLRGRAASRMYAAELERDQAQTQREARSQDLEDQQRQAQIEALQVETEVNRRPPERQVEYDAEGRPYWFEGGRVQYGEGRIAVPPRGGAAGQYRPITPEEAASYGITDRTGVAMGSNGLPVRVDNQRPPLSRSDERLLNNATDAADAATRFADLAQQFLNINRTVGTGGLGVELRAAGLGGQRAGYEQMEGITQSMIPLVRSMAGETGIMTDSDALRIERSLPNIRRSAEANQAFINIARQVAQNAQDRETLYERLASEGRISEARRIWRDYLRQNPLFDASGQLRTDRPSYAEWEAERAGAPPPAQGGGNGDGQRRLRWNPATGDLE